MTEKTLDIIHRAYQESVKKSKDIIYIVNNLYDILSQDKTIPEEDLETFDTFLEGLQSCIQTRYKTFDLTNLLCDYTFATMYIIRWLNSELGMDIDIGLIVNRKGLESDLTKNLRNSITKGSGLINDRFRYKGIIFNNNSPEHLIEVSKYIVGVLTNTNRKYRNEFVEWVDNDPWLFDSTKIRIHEILSLPLKLDTAKDFVNSPKPNGYKSLHFIFVLEMYSKRLPGAKFEFQLRTKEWEDKCSTGGEWDHWDYKDENVPEELQNIFKVDDFSDVHMDTFSGYGPYEDTDGIGNCKIILNRRISKTLVP